MKKLIIIGFIFMIGAGNCNHCHAEKESITQAQDSVILKDILVSVVNGDIIPVIEQLRNVEHLLSDEQKLF